MAFTVAAVLFYMQNGADPRAFDAPFINHKLIGVARRQQVQQFPDMVAGLWKQARLGFADNGGRGIHTSKFKAD